MEREYIGIDVHKAFVQACLVSATGERRCNLQRSTTSIENVHSTRNSADTWH